MSCGPQMLRSPGRVRRTVTRAYLGPEVQVPLLSRKVPTTDSVYTRREGRDPAPIPRDPWSVSGGRGHRSGLLLSIFTGLVGNPGSRGKCLFAGHRPCVKGDLGVGGASPLPWRSVRGLPDGSHPHPSGTHTSVLWRLRNDTPEPTRRTGGTRRPRGRHLLPEARCLQ